MKYPYIGKAGRHEVIFTSKNSGIDLDDFTFYMNGFNEYQFKNITTEYLANTYGEVKSKEHAEFIVKLAEVNGINVAKPKKENLGWFSFWDNKLGFFEYEISASQGGCKQITIPLPPESNVNTPRGDKMQKLNSITHHKLKIEPDNHILIKPSQIDFEVHGNLKLSFNATESVSINGDKKLLISVTDNTPQENAGMNLIFGDADKCKEWPKVGSKVTWGNCSYTAEVIAIHNNMAWVFTEGEYHTEIAVSKLQKPKTPARELRDEILDCDNFAITERKAMQLAEWLHSKGYSKKPQ